MYELGIIGGLVYIDGVLVKQNLWINRGSIVAIDDNISLAKEIYDVKGRWVLPGLIDPHVHFELGVGEYKSVDDFYHGSVSAAYGGITTFIDFLDPVDSGRDLKAAFIARNKLAKQSIIDYSFHVTVKNPVGQVQEIIDEMKELGMNSIKIFTTYAESGRKTYEKEIRELLKASGEQDFLVLAHIEKDEYIDMNSTYEVKDLPIARPKVAEKEEALFMCSLVKELDGRMYMVHLSHGETLEAMVSEYKDLIGKQMIVESCPHYFYLDDLVYEKEDGYLYVLAPPLREAKSKEILLQMKDYISSIGTDHCSYMSDSKKDRLLVNTPMGIGGIEHSFDLMYNKFGLEAVEKMSVNPAKIFGMYPEKGSLDIGSDADIIIYDPEIEHVIDEDNSVSDYNVYSGIKVKGKVISTITKGEFVMKDGSLFIGSIGRFIKRPIKK